MSNIDREQLARVANRTVETTGQETAEAGSRASLLHLAHAFHVSGAYVEAGEPLRVLKKEDSTAG
jgi:hypothetical protein